MPDLDRVVAGLRCREILERLSDYLDGDLPPALVAQVEEHLRGCDRCERFGGRVAGVVGALRRDLARAEVLDAAVEARLRDRLRSLS